MIPEPDYSDDEGVDSSPPSPPPAPQKILQPNNRVIQNGDSPQKENKFNDGSRFDENGLVLPKKVGNPCADSSDKKSLHKELLFNQKLGINVLNQKSELQKAMEKRNDKKALKEQEKEKQQQLTPLQKAIDERANRIEKLKKEEENEKPELEINSEFQKLHAKLFAKDKK